MPDSIVQIVTAIEACCAKLLVRVQYSPIENELFRLVVNVDNVEKVDLTVVENYFDVVHPFMDHLMCQLPTKAGVRDALRVPRIQMSERVMSEFFELSIGRVSK